MFGIIMTSIKKILHWAMPIPVGSRLRTSGRRARRKPGRFAPIWPRMPLLSPPSCSSVYNRTVLHEPLGIASLQSFAESYGHRHTLPISLVLLSVPTAEDETCHQGASNGLCLGDFKFMAFSIKRPVPQLGAHIGASIVAAHRKGELHGEFPLLLSLAHSSHTFLLEIGDWICRPSGMAPKQPPGRNGGSTRS